LNPIGFLLAGVSALFFGLYMVPRKLCRLQDLEFVASMAFGVVPTTLVAMLIVHRGFGGALPAVGIELSFLCGLIWTFGMLFYTLSVGQMGLALATPIKNTTAILGTIIGFAFFAEGAHTKLVPALVGSLLVVACAVVLGMTGERKGNRSFITPLGILFAILAATFFAAYTIPLKLAMGLHMDSYRLIAIMGLGSATGGVALLIAQRRPLGRWLRSSSRDHAWAAAAGACWALATVAMAEAIERIGLAVTWPISNLNTIVTVACGILLFREISVRKFGKLLALGLLCAIVGSALLGFAKS
jgi:glucose uptake protein GlcU